jgi:predicted transcriptional regulator
MTEEQCITVGTVMTHEVRSIDRMATVRKAIRIMRDTGVSSLAVNRRDAADEFGLLSVTDIAREVIARDRSPDRVNVYEIMSKPVLTLPEDMNIKYAVRLLSKFGVSRSLVLDTNRVPCGIVTLRDMVLRHAEGKPEAVTEDPPAAT